MDEMDYEYLDELWPEYQEEKFRIKNQFLNIVCTKYDLEDICQLEVKCMLSLELKELNEETVTYVYYPKNDQDIKPGLIKMEINTLEILQTEKSGIEGNGKDNYFIHAISRVKSNTKNKLFPKSDFVAWG